VPTFVIDLSETQTDRLNELVGRYNADKGTDLTVQAWLELHAREIAIQDDLAAEHSRLARQAEADVAAALTALRDRLLAESVAGGQAEA
jgi:hypothetical protein